MIYCPILKKTYDQFALASASNNLNSNNSNKLKNDHVSTQPQVKVFHVQTNSKEYQKVECPMC